uniref:TBC1 domain family member 21 n=1 Tax=Moschus moschiferus TaxID=68415 RepID=A0A8C6FI69_MOSMO
MTTLSPENSLSARQSASFILVKRKPPIDKTEWDGFFDENGQLAKSRDFICVNILERGLHPTVRTEAWKFLTGYYSWQSSQDERLTVDSTRRKNYEALCQMYQKIQPLLENLHQNFIETRNSITCDIKKLYDKDPLGNVLLDKKRLEKILLLSYVCNTQAEYQQGFHEMVMIFQLMVEHDHETFWLFQFFLQKTEHSCVIKIGVGKNLNMLNTLINFLDPVFAEHLKGKGAGAVPSLFPWFCLCFQRAFKTFDDVWRLWEVLLTGKPCRNFQVLAAYSMLQMVRQQVLQENMTGDDILLACNNLIDLDAEELISAACIVYAELIQKDVPQSLRDFFL